MRHVGHMMISSFKNIMLMLHSLMTNKPMRFKPMRVKCTTSALTNIRMTDLY